MAEEKKKLSTRVREKAADIYKRSTPDPSYSDLMSGKYKDERSTSEKIYDYGGERVIAPIVDMAGVALEKAGYKKGGKVKKMAKGGYVRAADGCVKKGKTKGKMV